MITLTSRPHDRNLCNTCADHHDKKHQKMQNFTAPALITMTKTPQTLTYTAPALITMTKTPQTLTYAAPVLITKHTDHDMNTTWHRLIHYVLWSLLHVCNDTNLHHLSWSPWHEHHMTVLQGTFYDCQDMNMTWHTFSTPSVTVLIARTHNNTDWRLISIFMT